MASALAAATLRRVPQTPRAIPLHADEPRAGPANSVPLSNLATGLPQSPFVEDFLVAIPLRSVATLLRNPVLVHAFIDR